MTVDSPDVTHVPKSATKKRFMGATLLDVLENNDIEAFKRIWATMERLAIEERRVIGNRFNLKQEEEYQKRDPPWAISDLKPEVVEQSVCNMYERALVELTDWVQYMESCTSCASRKDPLWFIRWFLYARFRTRDRRNNAKVRKENRKCKTRVDAISKPSPAGDPKLQELRSVSTLSITRTEFYDPVREAQKAEVIRYMAAQMAGLDIEEQEK